MDGHVRGYPFISALPTSCPGCGGGPIHLYGGWRTVRVNSPAVYGAIVECASCHRAGSASGTSSDAAIQRSAVQNFEEFPAMPGRASAEQA